MKLNIIAGLAVLCFLFGCASAPKKEDIQVFNEAVSYLEVGNKELAFNSFENACEKNVLAGCLYINKELHPNEYKTYSIMQGMTRSDHTVINISIPSDILPQVKFVNQTTGSYIPKRNIKQSLRRWKDENGLVIQFEISKLNPSSVYRIELYNSPGMIEDYRIFKTMPKKKEELNIGLASCMSDEFMDIQKEMWAQLVSLNPDIVLMIGDNTYADVVGGKYVGGASTPKQIWSRYLETRENIDFYHIRKLIPVLGVWDDHDYGLNNGDKSYQYKKESAEIFDIFYPFSKSKLTRKGPGVSYRLSLNGQNFYFLDARSFRDKSTSKMGTHLGTKQENWLFKDMRTVRGPNWLIKGDQYFGLYHSYESWERYHPKNLKNFLKKLKRERDPAIFVSGDRHLAEIMKLEKSLTGYQTYELTSSGIHSKVYPGSFAKEPNPRQIAGVDGEYNFMFIKSRVKNRDLMLDVTSFGQENKVQFSRRIDIKK
ncbi:MAG: alkaline phosphatase family protein [Bacteriovoracaceae bacterium]|nr:alkaline phosphatase family protein [Bacteriovoracaceae bacterium]